MAPPLSPLVVSGALAGHPIFGLIAGALAGLLPVVVAMASHRPWSGALAWLVCAALGVAGGIVFALPAAFVAIRVLVATEAR